GDDHRRPADHRRGARAGAGPDALRPGGLRRGTPPRRGAPRPCRHGTMTRVRSLFSRRARPDAGPGVSGLVRVDARTKNLTKRLQPGDIAVIDHVDLDRVSAEALVACRPAAVLNAARST